MIKYLELYRDYMVVSVGCSKNTIEAYLRDIKQYFSIMEKKGIDGYFKHLYLSGYTPSSQNRKIVAINSYYKYLMKFNYIDKNPFSNIDFAKVEKHLPQYLEYSEIIQILEYLKDDLLNKAIVEVLYGCGLRVSELVKLKISDIHYEEGLIECIGKGSKKRYVPINKHALLAINDYKINFRDKLKKKSDETTLFLNKLGHTLRRESINVMLAKVGKQVGLKKRLHPHMLDIVFLLIC